MISDIAVCAPLDLVAPCLHRYGLKSKSCHFEQFCTAARSYLLSCFLSLCDPVSCFEAFQAVEAQEIDGDYGGDDYYLPDDDLPIGTDEFDVERDPGSGAWEPDMMQRALSDDLDRVASDMSSDGPPLLMQQVASRGPNPQSGARRIGPYTVTGWNAALDQDAQGIWHARVPNTRTMGGYHRAEFASKEEAEAWMETVKNK